MLINARVATIGLLSDLPVEPEAQAMSEAAHTGHRRIYLDDWIEATVFPLDELASGQVVAGPAIIESDTTTVVLRPGDQATTTPQRWLDIAIPAGR